VQVTVGSGRQSHGRASIYRPSSSLSLSSTASSHDPLADVFTLSVVFGSNTSAWTTVTVASLNIRFVCEMQLFNRFAVLSYATTSRAVEYKFRLKKKKKIPVLIVGLPITPLSAILI
jgi:hypothetical protein